MRPKDKYAFYRSIGSPRFVAAPLVRVSELPFRLLCRRYGAQLAYTPMEPTRRFLSDPQRRAEVLQECAEDHPLIVQFGTDSADQFLTAAAFVAASPGRAVAVDLNLGCALGTACESRYGACLLQCPEEVGAMLRRVCRECPLPVTAKIRVLPDLSKTIAFAKMLEECGIVMLAVHGRTPEQLTPNHGTADWEAIRAVKQAVGIPVLANGNILHYPDVVRCLEVTKADGVMVGEALMFDPRLFSNPKVPLLHGYVFRMQNPAPQLGARNALDFMTYCEKYNISNDIKKRVLSRLCWHACLPGVLPEMTTKAVGRRTLQAHMAITKAGSTYYPTLTEMLMKVVGLPPAKGLNDPILAELSMQPRKWYPAILHYRDIFPSSQKEKNGHEAYRERVHLALRARYLDTIRAKLCRRHLCRKGRRPHAVHRWVSRSRPPGQLAGAVGAVMVRRRRLADVALGKPSPKGKRTQVSASEPALQEFLTRVARGSKAKRARRSAAACRKGKDPELGSTTGEGK
eukprot:RCo010865